MRATALMLTLLLVSACGGGQDAAPADDADSMAQETAPTMADFAGTWEGTNVLEGTPDPVMSTLQVSEDGSEWVMMLEGRDPIMATASMVGDSLILVTEEYESVLRDGVMVTVRTAGAMVGADRMVGTMLATYSTPDGETEVTGTTEMVRGGM